MIDFKDTDEEEEITEAPSPQVTKKKMLLIILPIVIVIGLLVSFYTVFSNQQHPKNQNYQFLNTSDTTSSEGTLLVLYDLPEIDVTIKSHSKDREYARLKLNLEIPDLNEDQISTLEALTPRINDIVTSHLIEIYPEELQNAQGLYWLKEDLLYRINLVTKPITITNINIKTFEIKGSN